MQQTFEWEFDITQARGFYISEIPSDILKTLKPDPKAFQKQLLKIINKGDIRLAGFVFLAWSDTAYNSFSAYIYPFKHNFYTPPKDLPGSTKTDDDLAKINGWNRAKGAIAGDMRAVYLVETEKYNKKVAPLYKLMSSAENLASARVEQCKLYMSSLTPIFIYPDLKYIDVKGYTKAMQNCSQNAYTKLPNLDENYTGILSLPWILNQEAYKIKAPTCGQPDGLITLREVNDEKIKVLKSAIKNFRKLPYLSQKDIKQMKLLGKCSDLEKFIKEIPEVEKNLAKLKQVNQNIEAMASKAQEESVNRGRDVVWLEEKAKDVQAFIDFMLNSGKIKREHMKDFPELEFSIVWPKNIAIKNKMLISYEKPVHYLSAKEVDVLAQQYENFYQNNQIESFLNSYFPTVSKNLRDFLSLKFIKSSEENIVVMNKVVFLSDLKNLEEILSHIEVKKDDFDKQIASIPKCFPSVVTFKKFYFEDKYIDKNELNKTKLGKNYLLLRAKVKELFQLRKSFLVKREQNIDRIETEKRMKEIEEESYRKAIVDTEKTSMDTQKIQDFYSQFKEAYESKDIASVTANLSDDWTSSSDGTDISDLEDYLGKSFRVFDEISYNISNLNIQPLGDNKYRVSYTVNITGEIYDYDTTHKEKSSVQEEVGIKNGKVLILKTFGGHFWSVK